MVIQLLRRLLGQEGAPKSKDRGSSANSLLFEQVEAALPAYLSSDKKGELFKGLKDFPHQMKYFAEASEDDPLQGDGWSDIPVFVLETNRKKSTNVLLLSNTCDLSRANARHLPMRVMAAPIFRLSKISKYLSNNKASDAEIDGLFKSFREQAVTSAFYLPERQGVSEESIVFLDNISSHHLTEFYSNEGKSRLFSLSQEGAWLLSLKLSIHFCRLTDGALR